MVVTNHENDGIEAELDKILHYDSYIMSNINLTLIKDVKKIERIVQEIKDSEVRFGHGLRNIIQVITVILQ